jgi:hypothetical protein
VVNLDYFVDRTEQKLRFARIHLDELRAHPHRDSGDDFERSHHESFLFHFFGAREAFLQELNIYYACGLAIDRVASQNLASTLKKRGVTSTELEALKALEAEADSYLGIAKKLRNHAAHCGGIPMQHYLNGPSHLVRPTTRKELKQDTVDMFDGWLKRMTDLLAQLRASATQNHV